MISQKLKLQPTYSNSNLFYSFTCSFSLKCRRKFRCQYSERSCFLCHTYGKISLKTGLRIDIHAGNYAEAKNIFKVPNFRNISICRNLEIKTQSLSRILCFFFIIAFNLLFKDIELCMHGKNKYNCFVLFCFVDRLFLCLGFGGASHVLIGSIRI